MIRKLPGSSSPRCWSIRRRTSFSSSSAATPRRRRSSPRRTSTPAATSTTRRSALNNYLEQKGLTASAGDLVSRIDTLTDVLKRSDASLQKLQQAFATQPGPNASAAERKAHWAQTAAAAADAALLVRDEPELNAYLNALLLQDPQSAANPIEQYRLVYVAAANIARDLQNQVDTLATTNGGYVQTG